MQRGLKVFEIADILDRRACHRHVTIERIGGVIAGKADAGDQKHQRHDEKQNLRNDPAPLQETVDKQHKIPLGSCNPAIPTRFMRKVHRHDSSLMREYVRGTLGTFG